MLSKTDQVAFFIESNIGFRLMRKYIEITVIIYIYTVIILIFAFFFFLLYVIYPEKSYFRLYFKYITCNITLLWRKNNKKTKKI